MKALSPRLTQSTEETEDPMITAPEHMLDEKKGRDRGEADGYFGTVDSHPL